MGGGGNGGVMETGRVVHVMVLYVIMGKQGGSCCFITGG